MTFEDEVFACIGQYDSSARIVNLSTFSQLPGEKIWISGKNLVFHLICVPFPESNVVSPDYFQEKSLEYSARGFQLIHLWQDQWIVNREIVHSRIAALLGAGMRIHARQTKVQRIDKDTMRPFFVVNHMQGPVNARYTYGLFAGEQLVAAASFSAGRTVTRNGVAGRSYELLRYASLLHHRVVGGLGKLTARFIAELHPDDMMTYADLDWASGKGYQALHFEQVAITPPQMFWIHPREMIRYYPHRLPEKLTEAFHQQNGQKILDDFLLQQGYAKIYNAGNIKFLLTL